MALMLYYHPFSSYCQKVLVALYERAVPFEPRLVDLGDAEQKAELTRLWPVGKFPVLHDTARERTVPESSVIIEYLDRVHDGPPLVPKDPDAAIGVRILDRFFDNEVQTPMQSIVFDTFRPEGSHDPFGVDEAKAKLAHVWDMLEDALGHGGEWAAGTDFSLADCAAAPALFYARMMVPFGDRPRLQAYFDRLLARPSFARAVEEAKPYRHFFPLEWVEG